MKRRKKLISNSFSHEKVIEIKFINFSKEMELLRIDNLVEGIVMKRPSKYIKCPYVADIEVDGNEVLGHTASLGCGGFADVGAKVLVTLNQVPKKAKVIKNKSGLSCTHTVYLSKKSEKGVEIIVGIHPKLAEKIVESALNSNCLSALQNVKSYSRETKIYAEGKINSRFDYTGIDCNGVPFIMEVKNVPLADYEDVLAKERKHMDFSERDVNSKVAYFPDGFRKKLTDTVSPRALKHMNELTLIKKETSVRCIMCYVIQRTDVNRFQPSVIDMDYRRAFKCAMDNGVEMIVLVVNWLPDGRCLFVRDDLPITPFEDI
jgi:DNA-binding sugar fermentation-stimulating protein